MRAIGILFVGMKLFKIAVVGIVKYVAHAGIGANGIVKDATDVAMVWRLLAKIVDTEDVDFYMIKKSLFAIIFWVTKKCICCNVFYKNSAI